MPVDVDQSGKPDSAERQNADSSRGWLIGFWINVWVGIILAGATIGFFVGFPIGSISGAIIFGIISSPFVCTSSILSWALWLTRFSLPLAIIAGACSGGFFPILASGMLEPSLAVVAAFAGGLFGGLAAYNYSKNTAGRTVLLTRMVKTSGNSRCETCFSGSPQFLSWSRFGQHCWQNFCASTVY